MLSQVTSSVSSEIATPERFSLIPASVLTALTARVSPSAVIVYVALASFADRTGICWPSRKTLAAMTHLTVNHISHATSELRDAGFLEKETRREDGITTYRLIVVPLRQSDPPPTPARSTPLRQRVARTDQRTDQQKQERAAAPEPPKIEPERRRKPPLSAYQLQEKAHLAEDWQLPDDWRVRAQWLRPELTSKLGEIAENFADYHRSKGTRSACWFAEWQRWIRREHAPRRQPGGPQAARTNERRYPTPEQEKAPPTKAMQAAIENSNRRFREQCQRMGIDPDTGMLNRYREDLPLPS